MKPVLLTSSELVALLRDIASHVEDGDSFGGHLEYEVSDQPDMFAVSGIYRIGNSEGQGGCRVIGELE